MSFQYNALAFVIIFGIGIPAGVWSALRRGTWLDPATIGVLLFFPSVPVVITVPVFQWLFALKLDWLPAGGWEVREYFGFLEVGLFSKRIILPILILSLPGIAGVARYMRAQVLEVLDQDFIRTARAKGLREFIVVTRHVVRNALLPIATIMGFALVGLLGGSIFVETLLGIPGIGSYAFEAVGSRDYDGIMALVIITAAAFIVANLLVDIAYGLIDPRIRLGGRTQT
ncbi:MAG: ABC transporter permease [Chloroflexi bacterium]|nr:ABC transporter permease [Chloroflexota bacterium]